MTFASIYLHDGAWHGTAQWTAETKTSSRTFV
jgi:hypothetical protein